MHNFCQSEERIQKKEEKRKFRTIFDIGFSSTNRFFSRSSSAQNSTRGASSSVNDKKSRFIFHQKVRAIEDFLRLFGLRESWNGLRPEPEGPELKVGLALQKNTNYLELPGPDFSQSLYRLNKKYYSSLAKYWAIHEDLTGSKRTYKPWQARSQMSGISSLCLSSK